MKHGRYNIMIKPEDWEYLGKVAELIGQTRAQMIRDTLGQMVETLRNTVGDEPGKTPANLANLYRSMMLETSKALAQAADMSDTKVRVKE